MTTFPPPLTRDIGETERTLRRLLEAELTPAGLTFPQWTALAMINGAGDMPAERLIAAQLAGEVTDRAGAEQALVQLTARGLLAASPAGDLTLTDAGISLFTPLAASVGALTAALYGDLPAADLEATHRTLNEVARRAQLRLAAAT